MTNISKILPSQFNELTGGDKDKTFPVFVYGSLLKGFHNHGWLKDSEFVGKFSTKDDNYAMITYGSFPGVYKMLDCDKDCFLPSDKVMLRSIYRPVTGEVYLVDREVLNDLDRLESNGMFYQRELVPVKGLDYKVWMYILCEPATMRPFVITNKYREYCWRTEAVMRYTARMKGNTENDQTKK
jgi:gamma-glutamylcyclotransferase (GGCT)/AIG2-like uncharacterized protein YtfP